MVRPRSRAESRRGLLSANLFLLRPPPIPGESLSSWRLRVGWANGYQLYPLEPGRLRRADPDRGLDLDDLFWIAQTHGQPLLRVSQMTQRFYLATAFDSLEPRRHPPWWLRARYGRDQRSYGPMFCPLCLAEDSIPYFRLSWRLSLNFMCPRHMIRLCDTCPHCGAAPWPSGCSIPTRLHSDFRCLSVCWDCGGDLRTAPRIAEAGTAIPDLLPELSLNPSLAQFQIIEQLAALRAVCHVFIRRRSRESIDALDEWGQRVVGNLGEPGGHALEYLDVSRRSVLIPAALELIEEFPERLVAFLHRSGVSRWHFCGSTHLHPAWFDAVVNTRLARQNRWVREHEVREVIQAERAAGRRATKAAIRRKLHWQGDIPTAWMNEVVGDLPVERENGRGQTE